MTIQEFGMIKILPMICQSLMH